MRTLTNDYHDSQVLDLGSSGQRGPFLITQTGVAPNDDNPRTHLFVLRPDGQWADFNAYLCQNKPEAMDEIVFNSMSDVMQTFAQLFGRARVLDLPIDKEGLAAFLDRHKGRDALETARAWAREYRERHPVIT
jgi:hypothetical protein